MPAHGLCKLHANAASAGMGDAATSDPRASGDPGAAGADRGANLWAKLPEDLQEVIAARAFAGAAADEPPPLAARRLAAVSKGFAAHAGRIDWDMAALRWDCRAFVNGELRAPTFAHRVARVVIKRELRVPNNKFPRTEYMEVFDGVKHCSLHKQILDMEWPNRCGRARLRDKMEGITRELHETFGQRAHGPSTWRSRHQGIVARSLHKARLNEEQQARVIGRLDRMFHPLNMQLRAMADRPFGYSDRPEYVSVRDSLTRDVGLLAST